MAALKNQRHEAFAAALSKGMSATDAYRKTYGTKAKNPGDIASRLSEKVRDRVKELQTKSEDETLLTVERKRTLCFEMANDEKNKIRDRIAAMEMDSKLAGHFPDKAGINLTLGVEVNVITEEKRQKILDLRRATLEAAAQN